MLTDAMILNLFKLWVEPPFNQTNATLGGLSPSRSTPHRFTVERVNYLVHDLSHVKARVF
ncbi:MAG: hypothetical protein B7X44_06415 [Halothiobacillus sp. 15-55-196]|jgi:hypothetical protein|nr:MAG: hypothetical protein B7X44_06415 [Halothiobacillus sp. 15-55-196]